MRLKWSKFLENLRKITSRNFQKLSVFIGQKSIFRHHCIQNIKVRIQIRVFTIKKENTTHFSQFISEKLRKNLRKSQAHFREKLRKLKLRQNDGLLIKKYV